MTTIQSAVSDCCNSCDASRGNINGIKGDQTGTEYYLRDWYGPSYGWTHVFRHPNSTIKQYIVQNAIAAALNNNIGYGQSDNSTFWKELQKVNYDASKITTPCNADCSSSTSAICMAAGYLAGDEKLQNLGLRYTGNMVSSYPLAGFQMFTDANLRNSKDYLQPGDILLKENKHTCIYVGQVTYDETAQTFTADTSAMSMSSMNMITSGQNISMFSSTYENGDAVVREFCFLDKSLKRSKSGNIRLSAINYAPLVEQVAQAKGIYLTSGISLMGNYNVDTTQLSGNCKILVDFLLSMGLNGAAAIGIAANVKAESSFNPADIGDHGTSFGICQWHAGRGERMKNWVGPSWATNLSKQMEYLWKDLNENYPKVLNYLQNVPNTVEGAQDAAEYFVRHFEIPGDMEGAVIRRRASAVEYFNQLILTATTSTPGLANEQTNVDDSFFQNSAMIGNSLVGGFKQQSGMKTISCFYQNGIRVSGVLNSNILTELCSKVRDKIYIELGINEISLSVDTFVSQYNQLLNKIKTTRPEARIYIISVLPVTKGKAAEGTFTMEKVNAYNTALNTLASQQSCKYLDVCSALIGNDGYLPYALSSDGIHFRADAYKIWASYMRTHY